MDHWTWTRRARLQHEPERRRPKLCRWSDGTVGYGPEPARWRTPRPVAPPASRKRPKEELATRGKLSAEFSDLAKVRLVQRMLAHVTMLVVRCDGVTQAIGRRKLARSRLMALLALLASTRIPMAQLLRMTTTEFYGLHMDPEAWGHVSHWERRRRTFGLHKKCPHAPFLCTRSGKTWSEANAWRSFRRVANALGYRNLNPRDVRGCWKGDTRRPVRPVKTRPLPSCR